MCWAQSDIEPLGCDPRFPGHTAGLGRRDPASPHLERLFFPRNYASASAGTRQLLSFGLRSPFGPVLHALALWVANPVWVVHTSACKCWLGGESIVVYLIIIIMYYLLLFIIIYLFQFTAKHPSIHWQVN